MTQQSIASRREAAGSPTLAVNLVRRDEADSPIAMSDVLDTVCRGGVVVVSQGMQAVGLQEAICADADETIARVTSADKLARARQEGVERLHEILTPQEIYDVNRLLSERLNRKSIPFVRRVVEDLLGHKDGFYALNMIMARFFTPYDVFAKNRAMFSQRLGSLKIQNPHRDSWFTHALNGINLWIAIGRVRRGNGMVIYPDMWERPVAHKGIHVAERQAFGRPMNFEIGPGDILLFHGEHLHSSEINYTDETRFVLTSRFVLGPPKYGEGPRWIRHYYTPWLDGPLRGCASWRSYLDLAWPRSKVDEFCGRYAATARFRDTAYDDN